MMSLSGRAHHVAVDGQELVGADERERNERDLGFDGHPGGAGDHGFQLAGGRAAAFGEEHERETGLEGLTPRTRLATPARAELWSMGTWPERLRYQPMKGSFQSAALARMRNWKGSFAKSIGVS